MMENGNNNYDIFIANSVYPDAEAIFTARLKPLLEIKKDCVIVLDTNALLVPYTISSKSLGEIKKTYTNLVRQKRLVIPGQVAREFAKQRANKLSELFQQLHRKLGNLPQLQRGKYPLLEDLPSYRKALELEREIDGLLRDYKEIVKTVLQNVRDWTWNDPVSSLYSDLFSEDVVFDPDIDKDKIVEDLERRKIHHIAPGYKDAGKEDKGIGDLLIWHTILEIGKSRKQSVIFVSGDEKSDWWYQSEGQSLYPRHELIDEYRRFSEGQSFHIVSFSKLLDLYGVSEDVVSEIREKEQQSLFEEDNITPREIAILKLCQQGRTNEEIAEITGLGSGTVRNYLSRVYSKLGARNRVEAIQLAIASGILQPIEPKREIIDQIKESMVPTAVATYLALTPRELEILHLMHHGLQNREIAEQLEISDGTTRNYTSSIYDKLGVRNRVEAIQKALELGLISD